ncbi:MAG: CO dehydrogenase/acetyl-CoA synthase complex subunit epsilon [Candidatus Lokiarchaeota archaeon]|nr:CO dehydrogenase/acetyl-CoA synthase complex subunit epsilon [Candidatus Lokiarchaeota archaeon]
MSKPYQKANIPGPETGVSVFEPVTLATIINKSKNILLVIGAESIEESVGKKSYAEYLVDLGIKSKASIIATTSAYKFLSEKTKLDGITIMSLINITDRLRDNTWINLAGKGDRYDLIIFGGFLIYYVSQSLSTLKNYSEYRTVTLDRYYHPNARFSLPNLEKEEWEQYLESVLSNIK